MLSTEDFDRLISDPRLGKVKRFFHPVQCLDDIEYAQENRWKPCNLGASYLIFVMKRHQMIRSRVGQSRVH